MPDNTISYMVTIEIFQGDITSQNTDAIVNAANSTLLGGGGVDGAIHRAAGPGLLDECKTIGGCPSGEAKLTSGYNLRAKWVIHTVGPVWHGGNSNEAKILSGCYRNSLRIAEDMKMKTVAFPNISTGVYGYPKEKAAKVAIETVQEFIQTSKYLEKLVFVVFDDENAKIYKKLIGN